MQVSKDELMDGSKGSYRHAYCPAESMDQLFLAWQGVHDGEGGRRQPMPLCPLSHAATLQRSRRYSSERGSHAAGLCPLWGIVLCVLQPASFPAANQRVLSIRGRGGWAWVCMTP
jgi:hypothetical protein